MMTPHRASLRDRLVPLQAAFSRAHPECCSQTVARSLVALAEAAHAEESGGLTWSRVDAIISSTTGGRGAATASVMRSLEGARILRARQHDPDEWPPTGDVFDLDPDVVAIVVRGAP